MIINANMAIKNCKLEMFFYDDVMDRNFGMYPNFVYKVLLRVGLGRRQLRLMSPFFCSPVIPGRDSGIAADALRTDAIRIMSDSAALPS